VNNNNISDAINNNNQNNLKDEDKKPLAAMPPLELGLIRSLELFKNKS